MTIELSAQCDCGKVTFVAKEEPLLQLTCHCADCRQATSNDFSTIAFFKLKSSEISGSLLVNQFTTDAGTETKRERCAHCETVMFDRSEGFPSLVGVMASRIKAPFEELPTCHVWVSSKLAQVSIPENVKQYEQGIE